MPVGALNGQCPRCVARLVFGASPSADDESEPAPSSAGPSLNSTAPISSPLAEQPGDRIGRYKLLQKIGEGGCGVVYMAEQEEPVRRRVALKVIKLGMDTRQIVARFEAERQALAMMDHPNIARVFDGGATEIGRPYFVMELVRGIKITDYCDQNKLSTSERLKLFVQVCHAIQHAHQKSIIHRDIKPSNILVSLHDDVAAPKVIDFGIAKATEQRLTEKTLFTAFEQFIGTPAYMSPEQAGVSGLDIDTRSDIYSLGVLLYELLTGQTPFDPQALANAGMAEMLRCIREQEPPRPSTRLRTLERDDLTTTAQHRQTDPPKLIGQVHGDLDWIVMKCLEKNRTRRYATANALALDLEHFLNQEPVSAAAPTARYRVGKFVSRHRVGLAVTAGFALLLVLGTIVSVWQAVRATRLRERAQANEQIAVRARAGEATQRQAAEAALRRAEAAERGAHHRAYSSDMKAAQVALQQDNLGMAVELLSRYMAKPGDEDLRGVEWRYLWQESRGDQLRSFRLPAKPTGMSLSADDRLLAVAGLDRVIRVWDLESGNQVQEFKSGPASYGLESVCFSINGKWLAHAGPAGIEIRDTTRWEVIQTLASLKAPICFSAEGDRLFAAGKNGPGIFSFVDRTIRTLADPDGSLLRLAVKSSENATLLGAAVHNYELLAWDLSDGNLAKVAGMPGPDYSVSLASSPDGKWLAAGSVEYGQLGFWDLRTRKLALSFQAHQGTVLGLAFSPDSRFVATGGNDQLIHIWKTGTSNKISSFRGHLSEISSLLFTKDGRRLVSAGKDGTVRIWSSAGVLNRGGRIKLPSSTEVQAISAQGEECLTMDYTKHLTQVWSLPQGNPLSTVSWSAYYNTGITTANWHVTVPENRLSASSTTNGIVHLWNLATGEHLGSVDIGGAAEISPWCFSPDRKWMVARDGTLCNLGAAKKVRRFADSDQFPRAFSEDSRYYAFADTNSTVSVWDLVADKQQISLTKATERLHALEFSADCKMLAAGGEDGGVWIWSLETGNLVSPPGKGHQGVVGPLVFSPDGKTLITGGRDWTIRWWNVTTGQEMLLLKDVRLPAPHYAYRVGFFAGGRFLVWQQRDGTVRVTTLPTLAAIDASEAVPTAL